MNKRNYLMFMNIMWMKWTHTIVEEVKANEQEELLDVYEHNVDGMDAVINKIKNKKFAVNCQPVIDDMVHALTAKYPKREYVPGNNLLYRILERVPLSVLDFIALKRYKKMNAAIQGK
eukprot:599413_1